MTEKIDIRSMLPEELCEYFLSLGEPKFRAKQVFPRLAKGEKIEEITSLPKALRERLSLECLDTLPEVEKKLVSKIDGTVKYLFRLHDGACIESVLMKYIQPRYGTMLIMRKVFGYGVLTIVPFFINNPPRIELLTEGGAIVWVNILTLGCVASMLCYTLWNFVLKRLGTVRATNFIYFNPVVTIVTSWIVLDEKITWIAILGAILVLTGMYYIEQNRENKHQ